MNMRATASGLFIPEHDEYFAAAIDRNGQFEPENLALALSFVPPSRRRVAVDGGAHVGTWTLPMARTFDEVHAFEPHPENFACLLRNTAAAPNVRLYQWALGEHDEGMRCDLGNGNNTGCHFVIEKPDGEFPIMRLPPLLPALDFLKLDIEGYEYFALAGAKDQILWHRPVILIEEKQHAHARGWPSARVLLGLWGYIEIARCRRDVVFVSRFGR